MKTYKSVDLRNNHVKRVMALKNEFVNEIGDESVNFRNKDCALLSDGNVIYAIGGGAAFVKSDLLGNYTIPISELLLEEILYILKVLRK